MQGYKLAVNGRLVDQAILVVGCGGTGGFVAEGLCRLLVGQEKDIVLIDHDRVEPHNLLRQNFHEGDVGKFKSQALAERLSRLYGRQIAYSVYPFRHDLCGERYSHSLSRTFYNSIIIGCVDNPAARAAIADGVGHTSWWIDSGNGHHSGQVLIGNAGEQDFIYQGCFKADGMVTYLPKPTVQQPSLLAPIKKPKRQVDCAQAVAAEEQSPVINQAMAMLVLEAVSRLSKGTLDWMQAYIDLEAGTMSYTPATPENVSKITGVKANLLFEKPKKGAKR